MILFIIAEHFEPVGFLNKLGNRLKNRIEDVVDDSRWSGVERYALDVREKLVRSVDISLDIKTRDFAREIAT